ncbi:MAG: class I SAM-dependent methyltransferase [Hyphomicrobiales bacterium]|nr:class I SAM-dependent methyltransferase [Hyphomicrobiales bacterium]
MDRHDAIAAAFEASAAGYDDGRRRLLPELDAFYGMVVDLVRMQTPNARSILDLGAGTGLLSAVVASAFPQAAITLADISPAQLDIARARFAEMNRAVEILAGDFCALPLGGPYDAVISSLAIHHIEDAEKTDLFEKVFDALAPGGVFINAEQVAGPNDGVTAAYNDYWKAKSRLAGATDDDFAEAEIRMEHDCCATLDDQLGWLKSIGFVDVDCWYKSGFLAVYCGRRPTI